MRKRPKKAVAGAMATTLAFGAFAMTGCSSQLATSGSVD